MYELACGIYDRDAFSATQPNVSVVAFPFVYKMDAFEK